MLALQIGWRRAFPQMADNGDERGTLHSRAFKTIGSVVCRLLSLLSFYYSPQKRAFSTYRDGLMAMPPREIRNRAPYLLTQSTYRAARSANSIFSFVISKLLIPHDPKGAVASNFLPLELIVA